MGLLAPVQMPARISSDATLPATAWKYSDALGNNVAVEKLKGRPAVTKRALQLFAERYDASFPYPIVAVAHADCEEEAKLFAEKVKELMPDKNVEFLIDYIGPIVGATVGPGTMAVYFFGDEVTYKAE